MNSKKFWFLLFTLFTLYITVAIDLTLDPGPSYPKFHAKTVAHPSEYPKAS
jgi:hypothetical protein